MLQDLNTEYYKWELLSMYGMGPQLMAMHYCAATAGAAWQLARPQPCLIHPIHLLPTYMQKHETAYVYTKTGLVWARSEHDGYQFTVPKTLLSA